MSILPSNISDFIADLSVSRAQTFSSFGGWQLPFAPWLRLWVGTKDKVVEAMTIFFWAKVGQQEIRQGRWVDKTVRLFVFKAMTIIQIFLRGLGKLNFNPLNG